jgi:hypothetical protein
MHSSIPNDCVASTSSDCLPSSERHELSRQGRGRRFGVSRSGSMRDLEVWPLDRYALEGKHVRGLLLGVAALTEQQLRRRVVELARALIGAVSHRCAGNCPFAARRVGATQDV